MAILSLALGAAATCATLLQPPLRVGTQDRPSPVAAARSYRVGHEHAIADQLRTFLRLPNNGRNLEHIRSNAEWLEQALRSRGVATRELTVRFAPPVVYGEIVTPGAERTLVLYAHYDGQPTDPRQWAQPPFEPCLRDGPIGSGAAIVPWPAADGRFDPESRIYARSASDDKAAIIAMLSAVDALRQAELQPTVNLKFFFEGEEELGSIHLRQILLKYHELLAADAWIFCDGPVHQSRRQQVVFGVRGICGFDLTVYGARRDLHSGHYGNWAPNPAMMLAQLLATMKNSSGEVLVPGFYDGVVGLSEAERAAVAAAPPIDAELRDEFWVGDTDASETLQECINRPSFNVRGLRAGGVGRLGRNVVPALATASVDIRLVEGMNPVTTLERVRDHISAQGYHVVAKDPDRETRRSHERIAKFTARKGYSALRSPMDSELGAAVIAAVRRARGDVVVLPSLGGSLPLSVIDDTLRAPVIIVPIANHDNNQHAPDENLRLQNLWDGIEVMASLLTLR